MPGFIETYAGDTLWALMVFWLFGMLLPDAPTKVILFLALGFSFMIELSQFYQAPWIDAARATRIGGLVLGFGYKFSDLICYSVGCSAGAVADRLILMRFRHRH